MVIKKATQKDYDRMADLWEDSVASTYDFLTMKEIASLKKIIREKYFTNPEIAYYVLRDNKDEIVCFSGIIGDKIEFLFVDPATFGHGHGKKMLIHALKNHGAVCVDVHQQNMHALSFYSNYGFEVVEKSDKDIFGRLYPICHLRISGKIDDILNKLDSMD
ncbi:GNAT family N-acetyltransferase [Pseudofrancisella aestuarii]|uniref:GNAT family N-acetyltransferase n=1 Tax=Pseudofrancisella aestuarii TaxID=2670347 RepID=A0ABV9TBA5_9GAMM|nr:GNAT family N-acetyltransferase [Pseudofrancisella aestuarii]